MAPSPLAGAGSFLDAQDPPQVGPHLRPSGGGREPVSHISAPWRFVPTHPVSNLICGQWGMVTPEKHSSDSLEVSVKV